MVAALDGSSPHTRGTRLHHVGQPHRTRFIPAYAGNTTSLMGITCTPSVHPRIRGEHVGGRVLSSFTTGSSPHTRGTLQQPVDVGQYLRFIPAYAGNTRSRCARWPSASVHPRIRGEHAYASAENKITSGSSPHTRGTRQQRLPLRADERFIPAYAGNTFG